MMAAYIAISSLKYVRSFLAYLLKIKKKAKMWEKAIFPRVNGM